jgi:hypothetical protein
VEQKEMALKAMAAGYRHGFAWRSKLSCQFRQRNESLHPFNPAIHVERKRATGLETYPDHSSDTRAALRCVESTDGTDTPGDQALCSDVDVIATVAVSMRCSARGNRRCEKMAEKNIFCATIIVKDSKKNSIGTMKEVTFETETQNVYRLSRTTSSSSMIWTCPRSRDALLIVRMC